MLYDLVNQNLINNMDLVKQIVELWLSFRSSQKIKVKQPLSTLYINMEINPKYESILLEELNIKNIVIDPKLSDKVKVVCLPNGAKLGKKLWKDFQQVNNAAKSWEYQKLEDWSIRVWEYILSIDEFDIRYEKWDDLEYDIMVDDKLIIMMDTSITDELLLEWYAREIVRYIQDARKQSGYEVSDKILLYIDGYRISEILSDFGGYIYSETLANKYDGSDFDFGGELDLDDGKIQIKLKKQ